MNDKNKKDLVALLNKTEDPYLFNLIEFTLESNNDEMAARILADIRSLNKEVLK